MNKIIEMMLNLSKRCKGFPVVLIVLKTGKVVKTFKNIKAQNKDKTDYRNHAEYRMLLDEDIQKLGDITIIISLPPCSDCYNDIKNISNIQKIYYIYDPWNKMKRRKYLRNTKIKISNYNKPGHDKIKRLIKKAMLNPKHKQARSAC
ncbi:MAG: hypothetical protein HRT98_02360 [Mycoplasmatales bacterium]|nr:hypothetical protein [Mycoplasmatales bacterium]